MSSNDENKGAKITKKYTQEHLFFDSQFGQSFKEATSDQVFSTIDIYVACRFCSKIMLQFTAVNKLQQEH